MEVIQKIFPFTYMTFWLRKIEINKMENDCGHCSFSVFLSNYVVVLNDAVVAAFVVVVVIFVGVVTADATCHIRALQFYRYWAVQ